MTDEPGFLARWSRRKAATRPETPPPDLPPVESLGPASDFAAFLQKGVTAELQRQALAIAWRSDPVIAGFRGMADYDWDFNAPGYGKLRATDDVAKLLRAVLSPPLPDENPPLPKDPDTPPSPSVMVGTDQPRQDNGPQEPCHPRARPGDPRPSARASLPNAYLAPAVTTDPAAIDPPEPIPTTSEPDPVPRRHGSARPA